MNFRIKPVRAICAIVTLSLAKITVLGPVPAGIMKEKEAAMVAGIIKSSGLVCPATAMDANMGRKIFAVAVLEFTSVKNMMKASTMMRTMSDG